MSTLAAIAVLAVLIFVHELGHFLAARLQGIYANKFSIGFGPILWKYQGEQTEYALRALPLGGFVGFPDDDPDSDIAPDDPNLLRNRPIFDRMIVISAGVIANLIFAYFLLVTQVGLLGSYSQEYHPGVVVNATAAGVSNVAAKAGLKPNDIVLAVDGQELGASASSLPELMTSIQTHTGQTLKLQVLRGSEQVAITVVPEINGAGKGQIGVQLSSNATTIYEKTTGVVDAFSKGAKEFERMILLTVKGLTQIVTNFSSTAGQVSGPIKIVEMGANIASTNASGLFPFAAIISINLAIMNILPLPALDGGQLAFLLVEAILGKPLPMKFQEVVMQSGLALLLGLGVFLVVRDTVNLTFVQQLFN
jgi:membrane-associated protease RseP (regulator of RpoE activity)